MQSVLRHYQSRRVKKTRRHRAQKPHKLPGSWQLAKAQEEIERLTLEARRGWQSRDRTEDFLQKEIRKLQGFVADRDEQLKKVRSAQIDSLKQEIGELQGQLRTRDRELENANKFLAWFVRNYFGEKSEKYIATEIESEEVSAEEPPVKEEQASEPEKKKRSRGQQKGSKGHGRTEQGTQLPVDETFLEPSSCACETCGKPFRQLPETEDSRLTEIEIELVQQLFRRRKYVTQCNCSGKKIVTGSPPPKLYPKTSIGNSLWVHLIVQKFLSGMPTNRTLKELSLRGFDLAQGTVTGGFKIVGDLLDPLYRAVLNHCRRAEFWNADETSWRVFDTGTKRWWLWVIGSEDAIVYVVDPSRSKRVPDEFFAASTGTLMTDRFASYKSLHSGIKKAWCWVHQRRDFFNIFKGVKKLKQWAKEWLETIATLFVLNHNRFNLWSNGKHFGSEWEQAQTALKQHVESIKDRWQNELWKTNLHQQQKKVLTSMKHHWAGLTLFLEDPRIPLDNNRAERLIRNAVILRKSSYGSGTEWSGQLAAKVFSIIQTWLINRLDPQKMLRYYFDECSRTPGRAPPDLNQFLPWSMTDKKLREFALPKSYSSPG